MLTEGDIAPDFDLADHEGGRVRAHDLRGRWVVLWWYPKASTPG
ncbi:MAG: alkyl hydroperoxide reductase/Thiol specific antioxidant/Mal allergen [Acidimicrobiales bacterium]|jgi:peroxiredoxin Q/BCP|nr:alkyl hydroperoxide reductase/Thiol specific antioxidant/Mal allergen [Acidimicrobiales bacterium]